MFSDNDIGDCYPPDNNEDHDPSHDDKDPDEDDGEDDCDDCDDQYIRSTGYAQEIEEETTGYDYDVEDVEEVGNDNYSNAEAKP